ncbi:Ldh family oxidoreductase [Oceanobacillus jeddahense]|uniref:Ldh family oxidoreductase n=1 Tax=Oceanobacillus jeddahense TaxID=1462527 RepID=UPI0005960A18|nr:Ldh family oxidoreductase [Oceanobacillus jeddahense]
MSLQKVTITEKNLKKYVEDIFKVAGLADEEATIISKHLVSAELRGISSHGVSRVNIYTERLKKDLIEKKASPVIEKETNSTALINGNNRFGILNANDGIKLAVKKAEENGIGMVGIYNSNHCGMLADYIEYATQKNCIAFGTTNAPSNMAPWGGKEKFFGTNPLAYGIPTPTNFPIIFDMASSVVARGKITYAKKNNQKIPIGWALSKEGKSTTDPSEAIDGLVLPVGGAKGYGLAFFVEILSSIFTGAAYGPHVGSLLRDLDRPQGVGHFFLVMQADLFQTIDKFFARIEKMIKEIKQISLAEGFDKIYLPGEMEFLNKENNQIKGITLTSKISEELNIIGGRLGINYQLTHMD